MNTSNRRHYYWINTKDETWSWRDILIGDEEEFIFYSDGSKPIAQEDYYIAQAGDIFLGYQSTPSKAVVALGKVYSTYYDEVNEDEGFSITIKKYIDLEYPITIQDLEDAGIIDIPVFKKLSDGIFCLKDDVFSRIALLIEEKNPGLLEISTELADLPLTDILEELYEEEALDYAVKNIVYHIDTSIPVNAIFTSKEVNSRFGLNSSSGSMCKSSQDNSVVLLIDRIDDLQWTSQNEFHFRMSAKKELFDMLDTTCPLDWQVERYVLEHSDLAKMVHLLRDEGNDTYRYLGVAKLVVADTIIHDHSSITMEIRGVISDSLPARPMDAGSLKIDEIDDIATIEKGFENIESGFEREIIAKQRLHHSKYRKGLLARYRDCCLCHVSDEHLLIASHIRPWTECENDREKTDINNGLLLCPNHDRLFDRGFISFDDAGIIMISNVLTDDDRIKMNVHPDMHIDITPQINVYMGYHRDNKFIRS